MMSLLLMLLSVTTAHGSDWQAESARVCADQAELCQALEELKPIRTRAGHYHFPGTYLDTPGAEVVLLNRLMESQDTPEVRSAIVPAIQPLLMSNPELAETLFLAESEVGVRVQLVGAMRESKSAASHGFLMRASADEDPRVREIVASVVGFREKDARWVPKLEAMLSDSSATVRAMSARSLGWYGEQRSFQALLPGLNDQEASVRLQVLSALERIDADALVRQPGLSVLRVDSDSRIRHRVKRLETR